MSPRTESSDTGLSSSDRKRTPSVLKHEQCECKNSSSHCCTDKIIRCPARLKWHFDRGWPDSKEATRAELAKREAHGIQYTPRGKRILNTGT